MSRIKVILAAAWIFATFTNGVSSTSLKLLHVISANKFYAPLDLEDSTDNIFKVPKNLSYQYFLEHGLDLPNSIKMKLFQLGEFLRRDYDRFLGDDYSGDIMTMRTTKYDSSKLAGQLINAGLWQPKGQQIWNDDLLWQPIPFDYEEFQDPLLLGTLCPAFIDETFKIISDFIKNPTSTYSKLLLKNIKSESDIELSNVFEASMLYHSIENAIELNKTLPNWATNTQMMSKLRNLTATSYTLLSHSLLQKQLNGGVLLKKILSDSIDFIKNTSNPSHRINVYSADDRIFFGILNILIENFTVYSTPSAGTAIIFELHELSGEYFVKVKYYDGVEAFYLDLKNIPSSNESYHIDKFREAIKRFLIEDDSSLCLGSSRNSLKFLHVISANKFYAPLDLEDSEDNIFKLPKNLSYQYFLENGLDLPNSIKMKLFHLGEFLRQKYDRFLGDDYSGDIMTMRATKYDSTKLAGQLINAGLWPPKGQQIWMDDLQWQPIPFEYEEFQDPLLLGTLCPTFINETSKIFSDFKNQKNFMDSELSIESIKNKTGIKLNDLFESAMLSHAIENSYELNQTLPVWARNTEILSKIQKLMKTSYDLLSQSVLQKQLNGGILLKKIISDSMEIARNSSVPCHRINIYSTDERIFFGILNILIDNFTVYSTPSAGTAIIFELHELSGEYFMKVNYFDGEKESYLEVKKVASNNKLYKINEFREILSEFFVKDDLLLCDGSVSSATSIAFNFASYLIAILFFMRVIL